MTAPSYPALHRGVEFQLLIGSGGGSETFALVAVATTQDFKQDIETDDAMIIDVNNPLNTPVRWSAPKGSTWDLTFSGKADYVRFATLQAAHDLGKTGLGARDWQIALAGTGANGGGIYAGAGILNSLSIQKSENGMVGFTASIKGQGLAVFTANA